jgi:cell division cycle 2-like protein
VRPSEPTSICATWTLSIICSVALKKLKMDQEKQGFPITSLREIRTLMACSTHENIVRVREIVVGDTLTQ